MFGSGPILKPTGPRPIRNSTTGRGAVYVPLTLRPGHVRNPTACALGGDRAGRIWNSTAPPSPIRNPTDKLLMTGAGAGSGPIRNPTVPRPDAELDWPGNHDRAGPFKSSPSRCGVFVDEGRAPTRTPTHLWGRPPSRVCRSVSPRGDPRATPHHRSRPSLLLPKHSRRRLDVGGIGHWVACGRGH